MPYIGHKLSDAGIPVLVIVAVVLGYLFYEYFIKK
jgi:hypothetical protein